MSEIAIPFKPGKDYIIKFDALAKRLGLNRSFVVRNLLSCDPILIDDIEDKAKNLFSQIAFKDAEIDKKLKKVPDVITIRLDKEQERRFNALVESLGAGTKVQVLRNLLSGDAGTVATICKKAKSIHPAPKEAETSDATTSDVEKRTEVATLNAELIRKKVRAITAPKVLEDFVEELVRKKVSEFEKELRAIFAGQRGVPSAEETIPRQEIAAITELFSASREQSSDGDKLASDKPKRGRKKKVPSGIDRSETRRQIIKYFNLKSGRSLGYDTAESIKAIDERLDEGKPVSEFMAIIDNMCHWWKDVNSNGYTNLFPETIFRPTRWDRNLANKPAPPKGPNVSGQPLVNPNKYDNFYL